MQIDKDRTALVLVDIQNDFLTEGGKYYVMIEELMKRNDVNARLETLLKTCKLHNFPVLMSPHYFFPHDHKGKHNQNNKEDNKKHETNTTATNEKKTKNNTTKINWRFMANAMWTTEET